ncbi:MAG: hypothetical protein CVU62_02380 [Deltaproteobacteria bacterium HGW-Deltaproteobacteria-2]|jgi:hypothetical protein|nr:MAG: hypothetical protein CVU62_02380 [Deltaproteobacteria bacterium HGW-Deltaproteobacteria-2]
MPLSDFSYGKPPSVEFIKNFFDKHLPQFSDDLGLGKNVKFEIDLSIGQQVFLKYLEDMDIYDRYSEIKCPNVYKKMGHLAFWIRKLKPIKSLENVTDSKEFIPIINEIFAISLAFLYCNYDTNNPKLKTNPEITSDQWQDLLLYLRYKSVSPHSLMMLLLFTYGIKFVKADK